MSRRLTTEEFVEKAEKVHGHIYSYEDVNYINNSTKVRIFCKEHNQIFEQTPNCHLGGQGCRLCGFNKISKNGRGNTKEFIRRARKIHNDRYDYMESFYKYSNIKLKVRCKKHGIWKITPANHLSGYGCPKCGHEKVANSHRQTQDEFIKKAKKRYGNKYDYSEVEYINSYSKKVKIKCIYHNSFFYQLPQDHIQGCGCLLCGREKITGRTSLTFKQFLSRAKKIHGKGKYKYSKENKKQFKNTNSMIMIECRKHGLFIQRVSSHLEGVGCPHCILKNEGKVKILLYKYFSDFNFKTNKRIWDSYKDYNHRRYCDFWLERDDIKIMVEYDGEQHEYAVDFGCKDKEKVQRLFQRCQLKDKLDAEFCSENNIILHRIKYDEDKEKSIKELREKICA